MKTQRVRHILVVIVVLVGSVLACGSDNTGARVDTSSDKEEPVASKTVIYAAGDVIQVDDHTITLNSVELKDGKLQSNFTLENKGSEDINISSMLNFSAKDSDGVKLKLDIFDCGTSFDGSVLPGDKLKGDLCWKGATTDIVKVYYEANIFGSGAIVWQVKE